MDLIKKLLFLGSVGLTSHSTVIRLAEVVEVCHLSPAVHCLCSFFFRYFMKYLTDDLSKNDKEACLFWRMIMTSTNHSDKYIVSCDCFTVKATVQVKTFQVSQQQKEMFWFASEETKYSSETTRKGRMLSVTLTIKSVNVSHPYMCVYEYFGLHSCSEQNIIIAERRKYAV